tara:strand:+ start:1032 stop:1643 length:612 start_codon:yes stop_codon:yes gene_type:complete
LSKNKISKNWINKQNRDQYVRQSRTEGYRSRAIYKLKEIDEKYKILKNGIKLIDLGAAPGSWSQYAAKKIKNGKILSIDLKEISEIENIFKIKGDFTELECQNKIKKYFNDKVDVILSDMAVNTSGNKYLDSNSTGELCISAIKFSRNMLKSKGIFVSKLFMGSSFNDIMKEAKATFKEIRIFKPQASRKESKENFIICKYIL